ncbi:TolC family protein, partial [uncultured Muribaculum sp.]
TANDTRLALVDLAQLLELDDIDNFDITTLDGEEQPILPAESVYNNALNINHTLKAARGEIAAAERNISVAQSGYIPRLSFNAGIGSSYYTVTGMEHPSFSRQMKDNFNTYFGFSLSIPIFDGLSTRNSVKRARVQHVASKLQYQDAENRLYKTIQQAYYQAVSAQERSKSCLIAEDAANKAFEAMREKYNLGRATPSEYEQAKNKALRTTAERIQAHYELILRTRILNFYDTGRY